MALILWEPLRRQGVGGRDGWEGELFAVEWRVAERGIEGLLEMSDDILDATFRGGLSEAGWPSG